MDSFMRERLSVVAAIGCGLAFGVSGIYTYYITNRQFTRQIDNLTETIEDLKREVKELRIASQAASQAHSPIHSQLFNFNTNSDSNLQTSDYIANQCQIDSLVAPLKENSISTDDNEEFFDFNEGEPEPEPVISMNCQNNVDSNSLMAQKTEFSLQEWLEEYDRLLDDTSGDKQELYNKIIAAQKTFGMSADILWRSAKATHLYGIAAQKQGDLELKKNLAFETLDYATKAIECGDNNPECHKWYAIAIGSISDYIPTKEKIANGHEFKKHVDLALKLKPNDPSLHHMLGRFCFEVSNLSWVEKKVASALFSKVPESSYQDSLNNLLKAYELKPNWKENILFIAKVLICQKKYGEAIRWIDRGLGINSIGEDDTIAHDELVSLNSKHTKHR